MKTIAHVVRQGEYLTQLAFRYGFDPREVWNDSKNTELKAKRENPEMLCPGDLLHIPDVPKKGASIHVGETNVYRANVPRVWVALRFLDEDGSPLGDEPCEVLGMGNPLQTKTKTDGTVEFQVPVLLREAQVYFTERQRIFPIRIGELDPVHERSGQAQRLRNLGFLRDEMDVFSADDCFEMAVAEFQRFSKLTASARVDPDTRDALEKEHGC